MNVWLGIWVGALILGSILSAIAQSLRDLSRPAMEHLLAGKQRPGLTRRINGILANWDEHSTAITFPRIACHLLVVVGMAMWLAGLAGSGSPGLGQAALAVLASSLLIWVVGSVIPAAISRHAAEGTVVAWSPLIVVVSLVMAPLMPIYTLFDAVLKRLTGRTNIDAAEELQEEILSVVAEGSHEGQFDEREREMIEAVVRFRESAVAQIMTPRTQIEAMEISSDLGEVVKFIRKGGHSRIPVFERNLDHIVGVFYVKDLMRWLAGDRAGKGAAFDLRQQLRPAVFVPETKTVRELLGELLARKVHIAIVADEYGGTAGLVTIEDIVEEVFGDIQDEYEPGDEERVVVIDRAKNSAEIDARAYIEDVNERLAELGVQIPESEDYETVGGYVTVALGRIPGEGEVLETPGARYRVLEAEPTRVLRVRAEVRPETQPGDERGASAPTTIPSSGDS